VPDGYQVLLDSRPVRTPAKAVLSIPSTKPHLAHAIALEWDLLTSAQQALKQHLLPLTSLTSRANDIAQEDIHDHTNIRDEILKTVMRYFETDTLLCWVPEKKAMQDSTTTGNGGGERDSLRNVQMRMAERIINFLTDTIWPGIEIKPVLDADSIMPTSQPETTRDVIRRWVDGLPPYELAALERGVLAGKSLLVAVRLVVEWSEHFQHLQKHGQARFGIEDAAEASSLEVRWQADMWGEVEDSHDVDKEDLKRQLGSIVLLVSGEIK
jgi:ATP synthase mitochondrial F1 complex assembly factor 2